ncbi:NAD(P)-binding protein [Pleurotus eryngii]|uniref:D-xylose 1-dehydrogenase (NADP(+), D-xylono-1,5-lactone-forming) n=1 Tax=Pleurotus eryngii TaxID=5323 RepID=A0A9P6A532_PLEER|nr:NAD(P)-binding protein [Pleurotus eryngii]
MGSFFSTLYRLYKTFNPPYAPPLPSSRPVRFGVLGAAAIAPIAFISPAKNHAEAVVLAVAARDKGRAEVFAKKYGIPKAYGGKDGYQDMLNDPEIDAVYNPLPNGLHFEWTMKALAAGKHVLLEKPSANTADETRQMYEYAEKRGLVLLEAFHYRFHPAIQRVKAILDSGDLGAIKNLEAKLAIPRGVMKDSDIRFDLSLGGGALMDMGCYTMNCIRYLSGTNSSSVIHASAEQHISSSNDASLRAAAVNVDRSTTATFAIPAPSGSSDITATIFCDLSMPPTFGVIPKMPQVSAKVVCEGGEVELYNFPLPTFYHSLTVRKRAAGGRVEERVEKVYTFRSGGGSEDATPKGEVWWTTYRYQLEAFIDKLKGRMPQTWLDKEDAVSNIEWIEKVYEKTGLGSRPKSTYVPEPLG